MGESRGVKKLKKKRGGELMEEKNRCPKGGEHETVLVKEEQLPTGGVKRILRCKKCGKFLEEEV